jgi:hypothetical protein
MLRKNKAGRNLEILVGLIVIIIALALVFGALPYKTISPSKPATSPPFFSLTNVTVIQHVNSSYNFQSASNTSQPSGLFSFAFPSSPYYVNTTIPVTVSILVPSQFISTNWKTVTTDYQTYCIWLVKNSAGTTIQNGTSQNLTSRYYNASFSFKPTSAGGYLFAAACVSQNTTLNQGTGVWAPLGKNITVGSANASIDITTPPAPVVNVPPTSNLSLTTGIFSTISTWISNIFSNFLNWILSL